MADSDNKGGLGDIQKRAAAMAERAERNKVSPQQFLQEAWIELQPPRTSWPSRTILRNSVSVVLAFIVFVAVWVGIIQVVAGDAAKYMFNGH